MAPQRGASSDVESFVFGCLERDSARTLEQKLEKLPGDLRRVPIEGFGNAFLSHPSYADVTENDELICVKLGYVHDGARLLTAAEIVRSDWVGPGSIDVERLHGSATIIVLAKVHPSITVYRSLLSPAVVNYAVEGQSFLAADKLRVMALLMPAALPNEDVLP